MTTKLRVSNFKSIRRMDAQLGRINILVGPAGGGKSNILETLGMMGCLQSQDPGPLKEYVRHGMTQDLFHLQDHDAPLEIGFGDMWLRLQKDRPGYRGTGGMCCHRPGHGRFILKGDQRGFHHLGHDNFTQLEEHGGECPRLRFYRFQDDDQEWNNRPEHQLQPPRGENLPYMIRNHEYLEHVQHSYLAGLEPPLEIVQGDTGTRLEAGYPGRTLSMPLQMMPSSARRYILHLAAVLTNRDSWVVLEDPEDGMNGEDARNIAELIAQDDRGNSYLISTRSDRFLIPLLDQAKREEIAVFLVHHQDGQTRMDQLQRKLLPGLFEHSVFCNFEHFLGQAGAVPA